MDKSAKTIMVVDDDYHSLKAVSKALTKAGYHTIKAETGQEGLELLNKNEVNLIITDLKMPEVDGVTLLEAAKNKNPNIAIIVMTGYGTVDSAVEAMKKGAYDYLSKPINLGELKLQIQRALEKQQLIVEVEYLKQRLDRKIELNSLVGKSAKMKQICEFIEQVAPTRSTVLIQGESGTGKELIAKAIHSLSPRSEQPFVALSCVALAENLLETELFGHEKGAFTGAVNMRKGAFEAADKGTLFLDEIGEMSLSSQAKLLRVIEEREFSRVGSHTPIKCNIRIIAATNKDLEQSVVNKRFREDLFYRLKVVTINLPPLRERKEDIPLLVYNFLQQFSNENQKNVQSISQEAMDEIIRYNWPGNVRELKNCLENIVIMNKKESIELPDIPEEIRESNLQARRIDIKVGLTFDEIEKKALQETLSYTNNNKTKAAAILNIGLRTLQRKIQKYGL